VQLGVIFDSQLTNSKEEGAPAVAEASTSHFARAKELGAKYAPGHPEYNKNGTKNRRFPILLI
jgi:hypothetical protein